MADGELLTLEIGRDAYTVHVRPELVVEIAFNEIQQSPIYPGGLALRFARVKRYRTDKTAAEADTIATVRSSRDNRASEVQGSGSRVHEFRVRFQVHASSGFQTQSL